MDKLSVTQDDAIGFVENAFRNVDLPALHAADIADIRGGLEQRKGGAA